MSENEQLAAEKVARIRVARQELLVAMALPSNRAGVRVARQALSDLYVGVTGNGLSDTDRLTLLQWATLDAAHALAVLADRDGA